MERWLPINDFPKYEVSDKGNVRNAQTGKILHHVKNPKGYHIVLLYKNGGQYTKKVHRLVCSAFYGEPGNGFEINHKNGDKSDNSLSNLEWCTGNENIQHAYNSGLRKPPRMKKVKIVETGEVFESMSDCARAIGGTVSGIYDCKTGRQDTHRGYHFEWI